MKTKTIIFTFFIFTLFTSYAQVKPDSLLVIDLPKFDELTYEALMNTEIELGNISGIQAKNSPAAITKITQEQIQLSPVKNLAALLEVYVPGLILMTHSEGDKIGIRGLIAAENYKLLLLVNGENLTNMTYEGVITEIDMWDLNDIEHIEVIRGPGSVTYGTGAVAGVINIITKSATEKTPTFKVGSNYNPMYGSSGGYIQYSQKKKNIGIYGYTSIQKTLGQEDPLYYRMNGDLTSDDRYIENPQYYLADGLDRPQIKAHLDVKYKKSFKVWSRFTQSGQTHHMTSQAILLDSSGFKNRRHVTLRSFSIFPEHIAKINDKISINSTIGFNTQEYNRFNASNNNYEWDHYNNVRDYSFSQNKLLAQSLIKYNVEKLKLVAGLEYSQIHITKPWGKSMDHFLLREGLYIVNDTTTNVFYQDENSTLNPSKGVEQVENGIFVHTYSFLFESSYKLSKTNTLLISSRLDKPSISKIMFSPRVALISEINKRNSLRFVAQRSLRMMPLRAQYLYNKYHNDNSDQQHESINAYELVYTHIERANMVINFNVFYNEINTVGYTGQALEFFGEQKQMGIETDLQYTFKNLTAGASYSFFKLLSFDWNDELKGGSNRNNITFSDYDYTVSRSSGPLHLSSYGNGLNNWANNSIRTFTTYKMFNKKLIAHINSRILWNYQGAYDEMNMYSEAYANVDITQVEDPEQFLLEKEKFENEKRLLEKEKAYQADFRLNASLAYKLTLHNKTNLLFIVYSENLLGSNKRYYVSTGSTDIYPSRLKFIEEPTTIGFKLHLNF